MDSPGLVRAGPRPQQPGLAVSWGGGGVVFREKFHRATIFLFFSQTCPIPHSHYPQGCFSCPSLGRARGLMKTSWGLSIFPECICLSRRQCYPQMLKRPFGVLCGVPETAPHQEAGESLLGWFPTYGCLTKQCWFSAVPPPSLLRRGRPGDSAMPCPLRPQRNITGPDSTIAFSPCSSRTRQAQISETPQVWDGWFDLRGTAS